MCRTPHGARPHEGRACCVLTESLCEALARSPCWPRDQCRDRGLGVLRGRARGDAGAPRCEHAVVSTLCLHAICGTCKRAPCSRAASAASCEHLCRDACDLCLAWDRDLCHAWECTPRSHAAAICAWDRAWRATVHGIVHGTPCMPPTAGVLIARYRLDILGPLAEIQT